MKILVIDDKQIHRQSARQTLVGHQVTIVGTYDEAHELLQVPAAPYHLVKGELERSGFKWSYAWQEAPEDVVAAARAERKRIARELCPPPLFDAVLCDLHMPASGMTLKPDARAKYEGQEMPVGFALAFRAVLSGAKYVAVVTDINHHDHPASAMLDGLVSDSRYKCNYDRTDHPPYGFVIDGVKFGFYREVGTFVDGTACPDCNGTGKKEVCFCVERNAGVAKPDCYRPHGGCGGTGYRCWTCQCSGKLVGKDWGRVLTHLSNPDAIAEY